MDKSRMVAAGTNSHGKTGGTARECLAFEQRPRTPPEVGRFRKSTTLAPGTRYLHHGTQADYNAMGLGELTFGEKSERGDNTAADLLNHNKLTEMEQINFEKSERIYRQRAMEPLGRSVDRHMVMPDKHTLGKVPFGVSSRASAEPAKDILFPLLNQEDLEAEKIYVRSHGSWAPGEQKRRGYDWKNIDVDTQVFGVKGNSIALNGVSKDISDVLKGNGDNVPAVTMKVVEDFKNAADLLGTVRRVARNDEPKPFDTIYGAPSAGGRSKTGKPMPTAQEVIGLKGGYKVKDKERYMAPDEDLGKSITPGFRNVTMENRAFGCPSVRSDLPAGPTSRRSIADSQNYGDDVPACDLINPKPFSGARDSVPANSLDVPKPREKVIATFSKIGYPLKPAVANLIFEEAAENENGPGAELCSLNAFRASLNVYLQATDNNREAQWLAARGGGGL